MLDYTMFYKKYGIRKLEDIINAKAFQYDQIEFPKSMMLFWVKVSDIPIGPTRSIGYMDAFTGSVIHNVEKYHDNPIGNPIFKPNQVNPLINDLKRQEPKFKYLKPGISNVKLPVTKPFIYNFGLLGVTYKYTTNPFNDYYRWYNTLKTAVMLATAEYSGTERHKFILIDLPSSLPERPRLDIFKDRVTRNTLTELPTYKHLNVLELWRALSPEKEEPAILDLIPEEELRNVTLVFNIDNKLSFFNLHLFYSIVSEYAIESKITSKSSEAVRKMMYVYINKLANNVTSNDELETTSTVDKPEVKKDELIRTEHILDDMLEDDINPDEDISEFDIDKELDKVEDTSSNLPDESILTETDEPFFEDIGITTDDEMINGVLDITESTDDVEKLVSQSNEEIILRQIEQLKKDKIITKAKADKLLEVLNNQKKMKIKIPGVGDKPLSELLNITEEDTKFDKSKAKIKSSNTVLDESMNNDTTNVLNREYMSKLYRKDITSTIFALQNSGNLISDYEIEQVDDILGGYEEHTFKILPFNGRETTVRLRLPVIDENGNFKLSGNNYSMRSQKSDLPIRKINRNEVTLSSGYGKLFISKATFKKDDIGYWLRRQIITAVESHPSLKSLVFNENENIGVELPHDYSLFSRYIRSFQLNGVDYHFDYPTRGKLLPKVDDIEKLEKQNDKMVLIGSKDGKIPVFINDEGNLYQLLNGKLKELPDLYEQLDIDMNTAPIEHINIKIYKKQTPIALMLSYYLKLDNLLKLLKTKHRIEDSNKRIQVEENEFVIKFNDKQYILKRDYGISDIIMAGYQSIAKNIKEYPITTFNSRNGIESFLSKMGYAPNYITEIRLLETMFIDPITLSVLKLIKEPETFKGLLVRAGELLLDDYYEHPNNIEGMCFKGNERISLMMYSEIINALRVHKNKSIFSRSKLAINPYGVWAKINEDSSTIPIDDLNPIAMIKQTEDVTSLGHGGRSKDSMSKSTRELHVSEIGIMSEAVKDNGDVGITAYMSANPTIESLRGLPGKLDFKKNGLSSVLSSVGMLMYGTTIDDPKRSVFSSIQASHVVPMVKSSSFSVRTGYESIIGIRVNDKYVVNAKHDGKVIDVTKSKLTVEYFIQGEDKPKKFNYPMKQWTTKEEAGSCYTHNMVPNVRKGQTFSKDDTLVYDELFFEKDYFNPSRVIYKAGTEVNTMLIEGMSTYEDSSAISSKVSGKLATTTTMIKSIIIDATNEVINPVNVGDKVDATTPLFSITDASITPVTDLDPKSLEILQRLRSATPKASYRGKISKIVIYYNSEYDDLSNTLKKLVDISDKEIKESTGKNNYSGKVNSSYSINGKPLREGQVEIKVYIDTVINMGTADKCIFGNQLKSTIGEVFDDEHITEDGLFEIEAKFGKKNIDARIVNSPMVIGTTTTLLYVLGKQVVAKYFDK